MNKPTVKQVPAHTNNYSTNSYTKTGIVLHWIVGTLESADVAFQNPTRIASTHYGISDTGEVHQYVADKYTAYHAGVAQYNRSHFGIEHEGGYLVNGQRVKPSPKCHEKSAELVAWLCETYNIPCDRKHIIKHSETGYATQCSGSLDIDLIISKANIILNQKPTMKITEGNLKKMKTLVDKYNTSVFKTLKTEVELHAWWIKNGIYETLNYVNKLIEQSSKRAAEIKQLKAEKVLLQNEIDALKKENTSLKASNAKLTKQNDELDSSNKDMTVMVMNLEELNHTLQDENDDLSAKLETASTLAMKWEEKYKKCAEGQQGTTIDLDAIVTHAIRWIRGLLNRLFDKLTSWRK